MKTIPELLDLLTLNEAAYVLASTGHCTLPAGFSEPAAIRMPKEGRPYILRNDPLDIWGFTTERGGETYAVFRGTQITSGVEFIQEWCEDALCLPLVPFAGGKVHLGFYGAWAALRTSLPQSPDVITGHSLGAAIATLCYAEKGGELVTFAGPRVGDDLFAGHLDQGRVTRIVNGKDVVPAVPSDPPFRHGGGALRVWCPGSRLDLKLAHSLETYRAGLTSLAASAAA